MAFYCNDEDIKECNQEYPELIEVLFEYKTDLIERLGCLNNTGNQHIIVVLKTIDPGVKKFAEFLDRDIDWREFSENCYVLGVASREHLMNFPNINEFVVQSIISSDKYAVLLVTRLGFKLHIIE